MAARASATWWGKIVRMETTVVRSEAEALLLENNLIKTLNPKYNILFRDDKSYPYLKISGRGSAPPAAHGRCAGRARCFRGCPITAARSKKSTATFGPYPSAWAVKEAILLLQKVFRLRTCEDTVFQPHAALPAVPDQALFRPCVGHLARGLCAGCAANAERFLRGDARRCWRRWSRA
jgi:excinuclease ABC subunit C